MEMNQMFDFYDGGGLDLCCLGAAEVSPSGDVNVSRMSKKKLTGPGGFIDIAMSTRNICFMTTMTAKGLSISASDGELKIEQEGKIKKFVDSIYETTFSGDEAVRRGQKVFYVTERAVFRRSNDHDVIELIEIAPGIDLEKDVLDQMSFTPVISPDLREMDRRIFTDKKMGAGYDFFGSLEDRVTYDEETHTIYLELFGIVLNSEDDVSWFEGAVREVLRPYMEARGKVNMISNYDGFELGRGLEDFYTKKIEAIQNDCYNTWTRYTGSAFRRAKLKSTMAIGDLNLDDLFDECSREGKDTLSLEELREGFENKFHIQLTPSQIHKFQKVGSGVDRAAFKEGVQSILRWKKHTS
jgi:propionate CoA-transferase